MVPNTQHIPIPGSNSTSGLPVMMTFAPPDTSSHDGVKSTILHKTCTPEGVAGTCRTMPDVRLVCIEVSASPRSVAFARCPLNSSAASASPALVLGSPPGSSLARCSEDAIARSTSCSSVLI